MVSEIKQIKGKEGAGAQYSTHACLRGFTIKFNFLLDGRENLIIAGTFPLCMINCPKDITVSVIQVKCIVESIFYLNHFDASTF